MVTQEGDTANLKEHIKKKPGPNNPEEATRFVQEVDKAVQKFTNTVHQYEPYSIQNAYSDFIQRYFDLLCDIEEYYKDASIATVLELIDDTTCKILRVETEKERTDQQLCKDPRISKDNIMQVHHVLNHLEALPGFKKFEGSEQFAISELLRSLQNAHKASAEVAGHLASLPRTLQPSQFEFILKHSVHPLIQFEVPPRLCNPEELCFTKSELTSEETFEQWAMNNVLPRPYHPKLETVEGKNATRCLTVVVHYQLWQKLFTKFRDSQANIADMFSVERKKFYTSITGHTYDVGKKLMKAEKKEQEACNLDLKKQKLMKQGIKPEKQETKGDKKEPQEENPKEKSTDDSNDMPMLISDEDDQDNPQWGAIKK